MVYQQPSFGSSGSRQLQPAQGRGKAIILFIIIVCVAALVLALLSGFIHAQSVGDQVSTSNNNYQQAYLLCYNAVANESVAIQQAQQSCGEAAASSQDAYSNIRLYVTLAFLGGACIQAIIQYLLHLRAVSRMKEKKVG